MPLLEFTERGIYCQAAGIFIDPSQRVPRAVVTHAHTDHARPGCQHYLSTPVTRDIMLHRMGSHINIQSLPYGKSLNIQGVKISFHPAGHIPGSAQIRMEYKGEVWVVSGDYKIDADNISEPFELVPCDTFVTETTFALPVYQWPDPAEVFQQINQWWKANASGGITSVIGAYALGKAQRILMNIDHHTGPIYCQDTVAGMNAVSEHAGIPLPPYQVLTEDIKPGQLQNALVITSGTSFNSARFRNLKQVSFAFASGWMILRGRKRWYHVDRGFILSDHADWNDLNSTITATGCHHVICTHGYTEIFAEWIRERGYRATVAGINL